MNWKNLSLLYCLKVCQIGKSIPGVVHNLHEAAAPIWYYIDKHHEKYQVYPSVKKVLTKFNLDRTEFWDRSATLKSIRDELFLEKTKFLLTEMQASIQEKLLDESQDYSVPQLLEPLESVITSVTQIELKPAVRLSKFMKVVNKFMSPDNTERVCNYGFPLLDRSTGGISKKDYILFFADTGENKSTFARTIAFNIASQGRTVLFITLEESGSKGVIKTASIGAKVDSNSIFDADLSRKSERRLRSLQRKIRRAGGDVIFIDDLENRNISGIHALVQKYKPDIVVLDQLSHFLPNAGGYKSNKAIYELIYYASKSIQSYIKTQKIPFIVLHQAQRSSKKGNKDELGLGYGPMQDCDVSIYFSPNEPAEDGGTWKRIRLPKVRDRRSDVCIDYYLNLSKGIVREQARSLEEPPEVQELLSSKVRYEN